VKERSQVISGVELKLVDRRCEEAALGDVVKRLATQNHLLVKIEMEYVTATQKLSSRRNREIRRLTRKAHDFEEELDQTSRMKTGIFSPFAKKAKGHKMVEVTRKLDSAKSDIELVVQGFQVEQEKLHDEYEKEKQTVIRQVRNLEKEVEVLETDGSVEDRRVACEALVNTLKALLRRKKLSFK
jgi:hypothetical protein